MMSRNIRGLETFGSRRWSGGYGQMVFRSLGPPGLPWILIPLGRFRYANSDLEVAGTGWIAEPPDYTGIPKRWRSPKSNLDSVCRVAESGAESRKVALTSRKPPHLGFVLPPLVGQC